MTKFVKINLILLLLFHFGNAPAVKITIGTGSEKKIISINIFGKNNNSLV